MMHRHWWKGYRCNDDVGNMVTLINVVRWVKNYKQLDEKLK